MRRAREVKPSWMAMPMRRRNTPSQVASVLGGDAVLVGVDEFVGDLSEGDKGEDGRGGADHFKDKCYGGMCRHGAEQPRE